MKGRALLFLGILGALAGCMMPYSRVGGTSHRKLYRAMPDDVCAAAERGLKRTGFTTVTREARDRRTLLAASGPESRATTLEVLSQEDGLVQVNVSADLDWREAVRLQEKVAEELGLRPRSGP